jgi:hypothetical protein
MVSAAGFAEVSVRIIAAGILALATTAISLRLLGTRRGWGTALVSGVVGWGVGAALALGLSGWDWEADGLLAHMVAIASRPRWGLPSGSTWWPDPGRWPPPSRRVSSPPLGPSEPFAGGSTWFAATASSSD